MEKKSVGEGATCRAGSRVDNHAHWFIHGEKVFIFIEDFKWDIFWLKGKLRCEQEADFNLVPLFGLFSLFYRLATQKNRSLFNEKLNVGARKGRKTCCQQGV